MKAINLEEKFGLFEEHWTPKIVGELNGQYVKLAKARGEMAWHAHDREDELFLVTKGRLTIRYRDGEVSVGPGEFHIVPRGVEHSPCAEEETHIVPIVPMSTEHTGDADDETTVALEDQEWI